MSPVTLAALLVRPSRRRRRAAAALGRRDGDGGRGPGRGPRRRRHAGRGRRRGRVRPWRAAAERARRDHGDVRRLAGGRGLRADQPALAGARAPTMRCRPPVRRCCSAVPSLGRSTTPPPTTPGVAFVTWTSGTTGAPKPVLHTHANYLELLDRVLAPLRGDGGRDGGGRRPAPNLVPVSLALNAGIYNVLFGLRAGAEIVVMDGFDRAGLRGARSPVRHPVDRAATRGAGDALRRTGRDVDLAPLRYVRSITAPLSPLQARRFAEKFGVVVLERLRPGRDRRGHRLDRRRRAASTPTSWARSGARIPGWRSRSSPAAPGADEPEPGGEIGRLLVRPPSTAVGIAEARVDADGYVDTGDLARVDDEGFVWIEGRASDVINRGGNKVFPEHVEEVLRLVPGVAEAAVVGVPDDRSGSQVVPTPSRRADVAVRAIRRPCPRSEVGKVLAAFRRVDAPASRRQVPSALASRRRRWRGPTRGCRPVAARSSRSSRPRRRERRCRGRGCCVARRRACRRDVVAPGAIRRSPRPTRPGRCSAVASARSGVDAGRRASRLRSAYGHVDPFAPPGSDRSRCATGSSRPRLRGAHAQGASSRPSSSSSTAGSRRAASA